MITTATDVQLPEPNPSGKWSTGYLAGATLKPHKSRPAAWSDAAWAYYLDGWKHGRANMLGRLARHGTADDIDEPALLAALEAPGPTTAINHRDRLLLVESYAIGWDTVHGTGTRSQEEACA